MHKELTPKLTTFKLIDNHDCFSRLPERVRKLVIRRLDWILKIEDSEKRHKAKTVRKAARNLEVSTTTVHRYMRAFKNGGWQALCDSRGRKGQSLPEEFKGYVREMHLRCQRSTTGREVHRMLVERWRIWQRTGDPKHSIPGYQVAPPAGRAGYPAGWSEDNLMRLRPGDYALAVSRQGAKQAAVFLPSILKTRVGVSFGQVVFFDDQDYDVKLAPRGISQRTIRPQGFNCLDYLSGNFMHHAIRLRWWDPAGDQYRTLTSQDFTWFVVSYLQKHGYRSDAHGSTFIFEHGTATGYNNKNLATLGGYYNFDEALAAVSHGCVRVDRSGLFNQPTFAGMLFRPQSSGNPRFKAPLESMFNLVRNRMAALPGATGRNRDLKPAEQYGQDLYTGQLLKLWDRLDERHRNAILWPMMTPAEFGAAAIAVYEAINARTDHGLEGWEALGFVAPQFRFTPDDRSPWLTRQEVTSLPETAQLALLANAEIPGHVRTCKFAPADVARQCAGELTRLPDSMIPYLIPMQWAKPATVKDNRTISIQDQLLGPEPFSYVCRIEDANGARLLPPGTKLLCYLNPFAPERLVICREDGAFIGTLYQMTRAAFTDQDAIVEQLKERAAMKADLDAEVRPHLESLMSQRTEMKRTNDRLAKGLPVFPDEIQKARSESAMQGQRTAAANRLQGHGETIDWDNYQPDPDPEIRAAWDDLPEDNWIDGPSEQSAAAMQNAWDDLPADYDPPDAL